MKRIPNIRPEGLIKGLVLASGSLFVFLLYAIGVGDYVLLDSRTAIAENWTLPAVIDGTAAHWWAAMTSSESGPTGRTVAMLSFALEAYARDGLEFTDLRYTNIVIHILTGVAAYAFLSALLADRLPRWTLEIAVLFWLLHPLHVSTVLYAVQRMTQLAALFALLGLYVYVRHRKRWLDRAATAEELSYGLFWVVLFALLAIYSKENGILLFALLFLIEALFFRGQYNGSRLPKVESALRWCLLAPIPVLIILFVWQPGFIAGGYLDRDFSMEQRVYTQFRVLPQYLTWIVIPDIRLMGLHHDDISISTSLTQPVTGAVAMVFWVAVVLILGLLVRTGKTVLAFCGIWFLYGHLLESTLLPLEVVYEHRNYLPTLGLCLLLAIGISQLKVERLRLLVSFGLCLLLSLLLVARTSIWQDELQLATYHRHHHPDSFRSVYHLANTLLRQGEASTEPQQKAALIGQAREQYIEMLALRPDDLTALVTLLYIDGRYFSQLESEKWIQQLHQAIGASFIDRSEQRALTLLLHCLQLSFCDRQSVDFPAHMELLTSRYPDTPIYSHMHSVYVGTVEQDPVSALRIDQGILAAHPDFSAAHSGMFSWYSALGEQGQALESARRSLGKSPGLQVLLATPQPDALATGSIE